MWLYINPNVKPAKQKPLVQVQTSRFRMPGAFFLMKSWRSFRRSAGGMRSVGKQVSHYEESGFKRHFTGWIHVMLSWNGEFIIENPINMDDLGVPPFMETPMCVSFFFP